MRRTLIGIVVLGAVITLAGQTNLPSFEVASIKPNVSGSGSSGMGIQAGGRVVITNVPVAYLIAQAYQVMPFQLVGVPDWANKDRVDINAKAATDIPLQLSIPGGPPPPHLLLLRSLLIDRFKLRTHTEMREMPIFALVMARADGKLGSKLAVSQTDCAAAMAAVRAGKPLSMPKPGQSGWCGIAGSDGRIMGGAMPMSQLVAALAGRVNRVVVDRTGLTGFYDLTLDFMPDNVAQAVDPNLPSLARALEEQLGLKLESTRGPVDVLVIDSVSQPTPD